MTKNAQKKFTKTLAEHSMLQENVPYSLTISPSAQFKDTKTANGGTRLRLENELNHMVKTFVKMIRKYATVWLVPELSRNGYFHVHGIVTLHDVMGFHLYALPMLKSRSIFEIDTMKTDEDKNTWIKYCRKDEKVFKPYCFAEDLFYEITNDTISADDKKYMGPRPLPLSAIH